MREILEGIQRKLSGGLKHKSFSSQGQIAGTSKQQLPAARHQAGSKSSQKQTQLSSFMN